MAREIIQRILLAALVVGVTSTALADVRTEARRHFRRGMELVQEGQLDEGVAELQLAYETLPHPNVLYNIGRAYAEGGRYDEALEYFERYLAADPPDREEVEGFITALEDRLRAQSEQTEPEVVPEQTVEPTQTSIEELAPLASDEEIEALEESAAQIEQLAEATQSQSLRERAERLRQVATQLREARATTAGGGTQTSSEGTVTVATGDQPALELGEQREDDIYEETVVSASRFAQSPLDAPNSTAIITRQDIRLTGITNIAELLRRVAGADVMTLTAADTQISFRGFNQRLSPRVLVLIDGRTVYVDPLGSTLWRSLPFNVEDIERIEVIRGPASALYGADAFAGIVNIITRAPGTPRTDVAFGAGNAGQVHGHVSSSGRAGPLGYRVSAGYNRANRFTLEVGGDRVDHVPVEDFEQQASSNAVHVNAGARYRISREAEIYAQTGFSENALNFQGTGPLRDFVSEGPVAHVMAGLTTSWGSLRAFWNSLNARATLPTPVRGGDPLTTRFSWNTYDIEGEFAREFHLGVDHNLHIGAAYRRKQIEWDYLSGEQFENHYAVFFQETAKLIDELSLVASFRLDFHPLLDGPVFSPRGAVVVRPTEGSAIRASFGTAFRTQTFLESYLRLRNPTPLDGVNVLGVGSETAARENIPGYQRLTPERILSAEIGYRNEESDYFDVMASVYYNRVTDLVFLTQVREYTLGDFGSGVDGYDEGVASYPLGTIGFQNDPTTYDVIGGEIATRVYPVDGLDFYANYAYNQTFVEDERQIITEEERTSQHKLNVGIQYRAPFGLDIALDLHWVSPQTWREQVFDPVEGVVFQSFDLDAYHLLNARLGWRLLDDRLELGVVGFNITNNQHRQHPFGQRLDARVMGTAAYHY